MKGIELGKEGKTVGVGLPGVFPNEYNYRIMLDTYKDAVEFSQIAEKLPGRILVKDNEGHSVNAKSILGMLYALEFDSLCVAAEEDIYTHIQKFIVGEST